jgi:hypothetical protein
MKCAVFFSSLSLSVGRTVPSGSLQADAADYFLHVDAVAAVHPGGDELGAAMRAGPKRRLG